MGKVRIKLTILALALTSIVPGPYAATAAGLSHLTGHTPLKEIARAQHLGRMASSSPLQLAIVLNLKDPNGLAERLKRLYDPNDPLFHQFLAPSEFTETFGPTQDDLQTIKNFLEENGFRITQVHPNRLVVDVEGSVANVENAFQLEMHEYISAAGNITHAPTSDPIVTDLVASKLIGIAGLSNFSVRKNHVSKSSVKLSKSSSRFKSNSSGPPCAQTQTCTVADYMTPAKIKTAYNLNSVSQTGAGETLALFELDGYTASDITAYASHFSLPAPTLQNVLVDGATGVPTPYSSSTPSPASEVTLDIELAMAIAPGLTKIMVYEAPNTDAGVIDQYSRIANDNLAKEICSAWGSSEDSNIAGGFNYNTENTIFQQMASQGQSFFAAAGDSGAYVSQINPTTLEVDDPASQPYVTAVGGTSLNYVDSTGAYISETSWNSPAGGGFAASGGGGGNSIIWAQPSWQSGLTTPSNLGSSSKRMVPDVALDADPNTGYPIYYNGGFELVGGTSCAAPLWAGFAALVNQARVSSSLSRLGFANPAIYQIGTSGLYSGAFHDISDGSTNLHFPAVSGYDLSTGWGSFNGAGLWSALTNATLPPAAPASLTLTPGNLSISASWSASATAASYSLVRSTSSSGPFLAVAAGLGVTSYSDNNLPYGTYYYAVSATNAAGTSGNSAIQSATTLMTPPAAPTNLSAQVVQ